MVTGCKDSGKANRGVEFGEDCRDGGKKEVSEHGGT